MGEKLKAGIIWFVGMFLMYLVNNYMQDRAMTQVLTFVAGMLTMFCLRLAVEE